MRSSLKALALVAVGITLGTVISAGAMSTATQTSPVTLCIRNGSVRVAADGACTARESKVVVASATDVSALAARADRDDVTTDELRAGLGDLGDRTDSLEVALSEAGASDDLVRRVVQQLPPLGSLILRGTHTINGIAQNVAIIGSNLEPGTSARVRNEAGVIQVVGFVNSDGGLSTSLQVICDQGPIWAEIAAPLGGIVESNHIELCADLAIFYIRSFEPSDQPGTRLLVADVVNAAPGSEITLLSNGVKEPVATATQDGTAHIEATVACPSEGVLLEATSAQGRRSTSRYLSC